MWIGIVSLFPEMFRAVMHYGLVSRALAAGHLDIRLANPRDFAADKHRTVDDAPYGGGPGQVMMAEPLAQAAESLAARTHTAPRRIYLTPEGRPLNQQVVEELVVCDSLILIAGHYEGIDERLRTNACDDEVSIGDYVLSGGELPAMVLVDALARRIPGVLGNAESLAHESFTAGRLEGAHYTRPRLWRGETVPETLLSGDHAAVESWRARSAFKRTYERRPELFKGRPLDAHETTFIEDLQKGGDHA
ncbi:MAG: tRNA (guanosine(37)-N1)-methyltransferase TrmD [Gammaproteobacteria bacterium]|nr:tRNA (guanosine(37)-N1)-methyltransferase TrmD [Gammaproteobacteria bacterium]MCY4324260.1 tRNA (guanosine(37)-N1)-methyltransferase TrmD [Gammaproteobacteria bacterium]